MNNDTLTNLNKETGEIEILNMAQFKYLRGIYFYLN